jgi:hypothetical protein
MAIQWNSVTWYSKMIALVIVIVLPILGVLFGLHEGKILGALEQSTHSSPIPPPAATQHDYYANVATWQTKDREDAKFSISAPLDFGTSDIYNAPQTTDWRLNSNNVMGVKIFTLTIPKAVEPQTNFQEAVLTIGGSEDPKAIEDCLKTDPSGGDSSRHDEVINGIPFTVFTSSDAGAGNLYDTTSYRAVRAGQCMAVEYTIHSTQIANYPSEYQLHPFDKTRIDAILKRIVGTFKLH